MIKDAMNLKESKEGYMEGLQKTRNNCWKEKGKC